MPLGAVDANRPPSRLRPPSKLPRPSAVGTAADTGPSPAPDLVSQHQDGEEDPLAGALTMSQLGGTSGTDADGDAHLADAPVATGARKRTSTQAELRESVRARKEAREAATSRLTQPTLSSSVRERQQLRAQQRSSSSSSLSGSGSTASTGLGRTNRTTGTAGTVAGARSRAQQQRSTLTGSRSSSVTTAASARRGAAANPSTARTLGRSNSTRPAAKATAGAKAPGTRKKRPAWDIKGRLEDMENETRVLRDALKRNNNTVEVLSSQVVEKEQEVQAVTADKGNVVAATQQVRDELAAALTEKLALQSKMADMQSAHAAQAQELLSKHQALEVTQKSTESALQMSKAEVGSLQVTVASQTGQITALQAEVSALKSTVEQLQAQNAAKSDEIAGLNATVDQMQETIDEQREKILEDETLRRKLHNTIQELKGNIRVFCRMRPAIPGETEEAEDERCYTFPARSNKAIDFTTKGSSSISGKDRGREFNFAFDRVFRPDSTQGEVFDEISQLVQSALDGYNCCVFAYGQTGSGKTFTMEGPGLGDDECLVDENLRGMIPRAVEQVFESAEKLKEKGWEYSMQADFIEIYNEQLRDLLATKPKAGTKYDIKHDNKGNTSVTNVRVVPVRSPNQVYDLLQRAQGNRQTAKTDMNDQSSRSHSVFQLRISGFNQNTEERVTGLLNLIDLAGSERIAQSGTASGQRLKETQAINKSLSALGDVIASLANKDAHTPYRNSKLTYLLQNSLGGNSKTLMFVNISPRTQDLNETLSSLRFATKVNNCEIGTAKKATKVEF